LKIGKAAAEWGQPDGLWVARCRCPIGCPGRRLQSPRARIKPAPFRPRRSARRLRPRLSGKNAEPLRRGSPPSPRQLLASRRLPFPRRCQFTVESDPCRSAACFPSRSRRRHVYGRRSPLPVAVYPRRRTTLPRASEYRCRCCVVRRRPPPPHPVCRRLQDRRSPSRSSSPRPLRRLLQSARQTGA
jgi:hypothetical protein